MKFSYKFVISCGFLLASGLSAAAGLTTTAEVVSANPGAGGVRVVGPVGNPDSCGDADLYFLPESSANFKTLYAAILTSYASDKPIQFYVNGCIASGFKNLAEIKSVNLK